MNLKLLTALSFVCLSTSLTVFADTKEFFVNAVEINKTKYWLPADLKIDQKDPHFKVKEGAGDFTVKKGDTVVFHLLSKIGGANNIHGFAIDEFKVEALVDDKGLVKSHEKTVKFVADKAGTFKIRCQLHPAHVGGHLIVAE